MIEDFDDFTKSPTIDWLDDLITIRNMVAYFILIKLTKLYSRITHRHFHSQPLNRYCWLSSTSGDWIFKLFPSSRLTYSFYPWRYWVFFYCCEKVFYSYVSLFCLENRCFYTLLFSQSQISSKIHHTPIKSTHSCDHSSASFACCWLLLL